MGGGVRGWVGELGGVGVRSVVPMVCATTDNLQRTPIEPSRLVKNGGGGGGGGGGGNE